MGRKAFVNANVHTVDPARPRAQAVVTAGGRIEGVGTGTGLAAAISAADEVIDLGGRLLLPGFQDAHVHPGHAGLTMLRCDLSDLDGAASYVERVARYATDRPGAAWVLGGGWSMAAFPGGIARAADLDRVVADRPVYLVNRDGHGAWVNTRALELAGIDRGTPDPVDGRIERDRTGAPVGTLQEEAMDLVARHVPDPPAQFRESAVLAAQDHLLSLGITAWQDAWVEEPDHRAYLTLAGSGRLICRVVGALWWERDAGIEQLAALRARRRAGPVGRYRASTVKIMLDGVCENHTAALLEPYLQEKGAGLDFVEPEALDEIVTALDGAGFQVHFHAVGDRAARHALGAVAAARSELGAADRRHHVAHLQLVDRDDVPRFAPLGVTATVQPLWAQYDDCQPELTLPYLGEERGRRQYPMASLAAASARVAIGSDWDVSSPDPFRILDVATRRRPPGVTDVPPLGPGEELDLGQAVAAYTMGSAYVNHLDHVTGSITAGKLADMVVVDRNIFTPGIDVAQARVDMTIVDGDVVYERAGA